jgi:hypothetical protein
MSFPGSNENGGGSSDKDDDVVFDENFLRQNAAAIAKALQSKDEQQAQSSSTKDPSALGLYEALCFDYPDLSPIQLTRAVPSLANSIRKGVVGLSIRLVEGIVHVLQQCGEETSTSNTADTSSSTILSNNPFSQTDKTLLSQLAWTVLIQVPLFCLEHLSSSSSSSSSMNRIRSCLGSYKGSTLPLSTQENEEKLLAERKNGFAVLPLVDDDDAAKQKIAMDIEQRIQALELGNDQRNNNPRNDKDEENEDQEEEVWASEEDPSDYDYGEGIPAETSLPLSHWATDDTFMMVDPTSLMKPNPELSVDDVHCAISSLLRHATYSNLFRMFLPASRNKDYDVAKDLTSLTLHLLHYLDTAPSLQSSGCYWVPLNLFRDAAVDRDVKSAMSPRSSLSSNVDGAKALESISKAYVSLIQKLLQEKDTKNDKTAGDMHASTVCGMQSLSAWCQAIQPPTGKASAPTAVCRMTRDALLQSMDSLTVALEHSLKQVGIHHLQSWAIPIVDILSGYNAEGRKFMTPLPASDNLLQSGFGGIMCALLSEPTAVSSTLQLAWFWLCVEHPSTLGKYTWRYPGLAQRMTSQSTLTNWHGDDLLSSLVWNLFGSTQDTNSSTMIMRKANLEATAVAPNHSVCRQTAQTNCRDIFLSSPVDIRNVEWLLQSCKHSEWLQNNLLPLIDPSFVKALEPQQRQQAEASKSWAANSNEASEKKDVEKSSLAKQRALFKQWNHVILGGNGKAPAFLGAQSKTD